MSADAAPAQVEIESAGGVRLAGYRWAPAGEPRGIVQLVHGMGEHVGRYGETARRFAAEGYAVWAHDTRGHGRTAVELGGGVEALGKVGAEGWHEFVLDIGRVGAAAREAHPGLPLAVVAHSLGSFAAQQYVVDHSADLDALVLSGTAAIDLLEPAIDLDAEMDLSGFNGPFEPARTDFDWLTRDEAVVDAYVADAWCGFSIDAPAVRAAFEGGRVLAEPERVAQVRDDLPVYVVVGDADPLNAGLALATPVADRFEAAGLSDVTFVAHPGARHEVFNETTRVEVLDGLVAWLDRVLPQR